MALTYDDLTDDERREIVEAALKVEDDAGVLSAEKSGLAEDMYAVRAGVFEELEDAIDLVRVRKAKDEPTMPLADAVATWDLPGAQG
jgi:hypothetical protein